MQNKNKTADFFMGTNSPKGFCSLYSELTPPQKGKRLFLIKGGAGTGKSTLMKNIAAEYSLLDSLTEKIHCSSDFFSLDGVILHSGGCALLDATPPHVIEPAYPGGYESVINLLCAFDENLLEERLFDTVKYQEENNALHKRCRSYLGCAGDLFFQSKATAAVYTDYPKLYIFAERLGKKYLAKGGRQGKVHRRLLSAFTANGYYTIEPTVKELADRVVAINDEYYAVAHPLMDMLCEQAKKLGLEVFACMSPFSPTDCIDHIIIPELSLAFVTKSRLCPMNTLTAGQNIHYTRFTDTNMLKRRRGQLRFNKKTIAELIAASADCLKKAKEVHDKLEATFSGAVSFDIVDKIAKETANKLAARYVKGM